MALKPADPVLVPQTTAVPPVPDNTTTLAAEMAALRQEQDRLRRENESLKADMADFRGTRPADQQFPQSVKGKTVLVRALREGFYPHVTPDGVKTHSGCGMGFLRAVGEVFLCVEKEISKGGPSNPGWMEVYVPNKSKPLPPEAPLTTAVALIPNPLTGGQMRQTVSVG